MQVFELELMRDEDRDHVGICILDSSSDSEYENQTSDGCIYPKKASKNRPSNTECSSFFGSPNGHKRLTISHLLPVSIRNLTSTSGSGRRGYVSWDGLSGGQKNSIKMMGIVYLLSAFVWNFLGSLGEFILYPFSILSVLYHELGHALMVTGNTKDPPDIFIVTLCPYIHKYSDIHMFSICRWLSFRRCALAGMWSLLKLASVRMG